MILTSLRNSLLLNDYPLSPHKVEIKENMLSSYQLKVADLYNIPIGNVKKLVPKLFDKEKYVLHFENLQPSYISQKIFDNDLVAKRKSKFTLTLNLHTP